MDAWTSCKVLDTVCRMSCEVMTPGEAIRATPAGSYLRCRDLPGTPIAAACALSRAAKRGDIVALRRDLYFKPRLTRYGPLMPSALDVAVHVLAGRGVGPTGHGAANALGMSTQIEALPQLVVVGAPPTGLDGVHLHRRNNTRRTSLSFLEIALLELLRDFDDVSERPLSSLAAAVRAGESSGRVSMSRVADALPGERSPRARALFDDLLAELASGEPAA